MTIQSHKANVVHYYSQFISKEENVSSFTQGKSSQSQDTSFALLGSFTELRSGGTMKSLRKKFTFVCFPTSILTHK